MGGTTDMRHSELLLPDPFDLLEVFFPIGIQFEDQSRTNIRNARKFCEKVGEHLPSY